VAIIADLAIKRVIDWGIDDDARFVVILIPIELLSDADGLLASVRDLGDAVSLIDLGKFQYIQFGLFLGLNGVPSAMAYISFDTTAPNHPLNVGEDKVNA
jgi:hypothetical protein